MDIKIDSVASGPSSLRFGAVIRGPQDAWVRFCEISINDRDFSRAEIAVVIEWCVRVMNAYLDSEPEESDEVALPGL